MYKVYIRPLCVEDAQISYKWRNDPEVWKFTGSQPDREITHNIELDWIKKVIADDSGRRFAIIADDQYVGNIQLTNIKDRKAEYHIFIGDKIWWGKGISYLATYQILHFAKEELQLEEVFLSVREDNIAAVKSYRKSSFAEDEMKEGWIKMTCKLALLPPPTVSVFVMVYNHEKYLHECLDGILMQKSNFTFNVVVGEDCSPDRSREILLEYRKKYPGKFKLLLHEKNIGAVANQNAVYAACEGKYIALCEGDDYWTDPLKLQKQVEFLESNPDFVLSGHKVQVIINGELKDTTGKWQTQSLLFRNVLKKDILNNFPQIVNGDTFLLFYLENFGKFEMQDFTGAVYRYTGEGVWTKLTQSEKLNTAKKSYTQMISFFETYHYKKTAKKVKLWSYDLDFNAFVKSDRFSYRQFFTLLSKILYLGDINRIKSLIILLPFFNRGRRDAISVK